MDEPALIAASAAEVAAYRTLTAAYRALLGQLAAAGASVDAAVLAVESERADAATAELRRLAARLASHRLGTAAVPDTVRAAWRESAALAADAVRLNGALAAHARRRQAALAAELARLGAARRGLGAYRPAAAERDAAREA
jgi:hypothetical protein